MYCAMSDLTARLPGADVIALTDDDGDGAADTTAVEAAIADADAEIDARLAGRYVTPFDPAPAVVRALSATLALERLYRRRRETPGEEFRATVDAARELLDGLARGDAVLAPGEADGRALSENTRRGTATVFDEDDLASF